MNLGVRQPSTYARSGNSTRSVQPVLSGRQKVPLRESQLQRTLELGQAERLEQMRALPQKPNLCLDGLVDAGAHDREIRVSEAQPRGGVERLWVGRLDEKDIRLGNGTSVQERSLVAEAAHDCLVQEANRFVRLDDQEKGHDPVLVDGRMFPGAACV